MKEAEDLSLLLEQHQNEIWEWKQKESQWIKDKNQLDGNKRIIEELSTKIVDLTKRAQQAEAKVNEFEGRMGSAQDINDDHQRYNGKLQQQLTETMEDNKRLAKQIQDMNDRKF